MLLLLLSLLFVGPLLVQGVSFEEDVRISLEQKTAIDKLRNRVLPYITEDHMKEDIFLVKWLRASDFDISLAERKLIENIKWRKENNIITIDKEDFSDVATAYPYTNTGFDREGRPIFIISAGWDLRGPPANVNRIFRYLYQSVELLARRIRKYQEEGRNVTQGILLIDLDRFNVDQRACLRCVVRIVDMLIIYENIQPGLADKLILVNAPATVHAALDVTRQAMSKETRNALKIYGTNKAEWQNVLQKYIDKKYLPVELGGTITRE